MMSDTIAIVTFAAVLILALVMDLGLLSKKNTAISIKQALYQTIFWVSLSVAFCVFLWFDESPIVATKFFTAYLMEWSLSIDNIFVFILIFSFFKVKETDAGRALLIGILLAIIFRIIFIAVGIELLERFQWIMYLFGIFLVYTGFKLFGKKDDEEFNPSESKIYTFIKSWFRLSEMEPHGRYFVKHGGKIFITNLFIVVVMLAMIDIAFALDSIPTVVSLVRDSPTAPFSTQDILVIYSSNIFAVLGLRSLFFLLRGAVDQFDYLQQGIAIVLIFIGLKMLVEYFGIHISIYTSLAVIVFCVGGSIWYSKYHDKKKMS